MGRVRNVKNEVRCKKQIPDYRSMLPLAGAPSLISTTLGLELSSLVGATRGF